MKSLHLAKPEDAEKLITMVAAFHAEMGFDTDRAHHEGALIPLLEGSPYGAVWLIGPKLSPVGYLVICFGWSVEFGGMDAFVDEIYIRPAVRRRGMGAEALNSMALTLKDSGVRALHLEVDRDNATAQEFCRRARFAPRDQYMLMTRML